jgi:hypothetical protein
VPKRLLRISIAPEIPDGVSKVPAAVDENVVDWETVMAAEATELPSAMRMALRAKAQRRKWRRVSVDFMVYVWILWSWIVESL